MKKKTIVISSVMAIAVAGSIGGYALYQKNKRVAEVTAVADLNSGGWYDPLSSSGMVSDTDSQNIYLSDAQTIAEVFVTEGTNVKAGDALLRYDTKALDISIEIKKLSIEKIKNQKSAAEHRLSVLKNTTPIPETPVEPEPEPEKPQVLVIPDDVMDNDAHSVLTVGCEPFEVPEENTPLTPVKFLGTQDAIITNSLLESYPFDGEGTYMQFEIHVDNRIDGEVIASWLLNNKMILDNSENGAWSLLTHLPYEQYEEETEEENYEEPQSGYTAAELAQAIKMEERNVQTYDLDCRKAELELKRMQETDSDGTVRAEHDGVVTKASSIDAPPQDGSPFLTVSSGEGMDVTSNISELSLASVEEGSDVTLSDWETGNMYIGTVTSIGKIPSGDNYYYGGGNQNVSYYPIHIHVTDTEGLKNGSYVEVTFEQKMDDAEAIWLQKAFVREEGSGYYVMKDEDGKLKKQPVQVGRTMWGDSVEILSGLTMDDKITFPYGKNAVEGTKTQEGDGDYYG